MGQYHWVPFGLIARIEMGPPTYLRDLVWLPGRFRWANGGEAVGLIPTRYVGSHQAQDTAIALARKTLWRELDTGGAEGQGQRELATDQCSRALLDVRCVETIASEPGAAAGVTDG